MHDEQCSTWRDSGRPYLKLPLLPACGDVIPSLPGELQQNTPPSPQNPPPAINSHHSNQHNHIEPPNLPATPKKPTKMYRLARFSRPLASRTHLRLLPSA